MKHFGDPCIYCDTPMMQVEIGECPGRPRLERTADLQRSIDMLLKIVDKLHRELREDGYANLPAMQALVIAIKNYARVKKSWDNRLAEWHAVLAALAPFDSPAPPTTLVDSSGRYEYEVKRD